MARRSSTGPWIRRAAVATALALAAGVLAAAPAAAASTTYYVSASGDDSNAGTTPSSPWKTLTRASAQTYSPGDAVLLRSGDTWTGETLELHGSGSSANWITLSSYGSGARPKIHPYASVADIPAPNATDIAANGRLYGVYLHNVAGWKISNLEVAYSKSGIVYRNDSSGTRDGLWIENVYVHDIAKWPLDPYPTPDNRVAPLNTATFSMGIYTVLDQSSPSNERLTNVTVKNVTIERTDGPLEIRHADNVDVSGVTATDSARVGVVFTGINYGTIPGTPVGSFRDSSIQRSGAEGMRWGTAGLAFNAVKDFVADNIDVGFTYAPAPYYVDGVGIDYEGLNVNVTVQNSYIHDNADEAVMVYRNPQWSGGVENVNTSLIDNVFENNGLLTNSTHAALLASEFNRHNGGTISGNKIVKTSRSQPLNWVVEHSPVLTETWPVSDYTITGNRVFLPNGNELSRASTGFAAAQGGNHWSYRKYDGSALTDLTWDASSTAWRSGSSVIYIGDEWMHPDVGTFTERVWTAPAAGEVRVSGVARKFDSTAGNGVVASIFHNGALVWSPPAITDLNGQSHDFGLTVAAGDVIAFVLNANGDSSFDKTYWDPEIEQITQNSFVAADDFTGRQGLYGWRYLERTAAGSTPMSWNGGANVWAGSTGTLYAGADWVHPAVGIQAERRWTAPHAGTIDIDGLVRKTDSAAGNGILASIWKNGSKIWGDQSITSLTGTSHALTTTVTTGDVISFVVDSAGDSGNDKTTWNPRIAFH
ncbi:MAG: hypothetical protein J7484_02840 [Microbacterium sp.]|nr:hypothetical protein [Microbacterium sp.]